MYDRDMGVVIHTHGGLLADRVRTESCQRAIAEIVKPGSVVLDLGCGSGILTLFACQAQARKVYAVEAGEAIELAKVLCLKNGFQDRIAFYHDVSQRIELPERVDVIVTETMGNFGLEEGMLGRMTGTRVKCRSSGFHPPRRATGTSSPPSRAGQCRRSCMAFEGRVIISQGRPYPGAPRPARCSGSRRCIALCPVRDSPPVARQARRRPGMLRPPWPPACAPWLP